MLSKAIIDFSRRNLGQLSIVQLYQGGNYMSGKQETRSIILASGSKFFLGGIRKILEEANDIIMVAEASTLEEVEGYLAGTKADFLFFDNRILRVDIDKISNSVLTKSPITKVIYLDDRGKDSGYAHPNFIHLPREATSQELFEIIRGKAPQKIEQTQKTNPDTKKHEFTKMELKVIELIAIGYTNKDIASAFSISEKTVKAHLTNIFKKTGIRNRYQLQLVIYRVPPKAKVR
jgi:DNA-binding NarL/FixJ family response regulator